MSSILQKLRSAAMKQGLTKAEAAVLYPTIPITEHPSFPVDISDSFLAPLKDPSQITVSKIDFKNSPLPEYKDLYAVMLDNVLTQAECDQLLHMAELSTGAHLESHGEENEAGENKGWKQALVRAGRRHEVLAIEYRDSGRILWDEKEVVKRFFKRILQAREMKEYLELLEGRAYDDVVGKDGSGGRWRLTEQGPNEKMRFLRYGAGQFFKGMFVSHDQVLGN
ncbi:hypothetical protein N431DRAFT_432227 [Stipitochalara longipes BDJ]|nr:hypothetical protein N431DRAFT_432227 [Stipitochalara longipes BDJ]